MISQMILITAICVAALAARLWLEHQASSTRVAIVRAKQARSSAEQLSHDRLAQIERAVRGAL